MLAEQAHVLEVLLIHFVACVKLHEPGWVNAAYGPASDRSVPGEVRGVVWDAADVSTSSIKRVRVDVDAAAAGVRQNEVALPRLSPRLLLKSLRGKQAPETRDLIVRDGDVQIVVRTALSAEDGINSPAAVDVHLEAALLEEIDQFYDIRRFDRHSLVHTQCRDVDSASAGPNPA